MSKDKEPTPPKTKKKKNKEKDKFIINKKYINYNKVWNDILIVSINIGGGLDSKIKNINNYMKLFNIDIMALNEVKITAEEFFKIKNKFREGKAYFNGYTREELQKEYQKGKENEIDNIENISERTKEIKKLQINKQKAPNKGGIIVIINNKFHSNVNLKKKST